MSVAMMSFAAFAAAQVGTPGPANMALMATGARVGFRPALPFVAGVVLGKQLIIWPIGYGLAEIAQNQLVFDALKYASAAYILWLAWRMTLMRFSPGEDAPVPSFYQGLIVHPLNPKAWVMIIAGLTAFTAPGTPAFEATLTISLILLAMQIVLHPVWTMLGAGLARAVAGSAAELYMRWGLAAVTALTVIYVLFGGGAK